MKVLLEEGLVTEIFSNPKTDVSREFLSLESMERTARINGAESLTLFLTL